MVFFRGKIAKPVYNSQANASTREIAFPDAGILLHRQIVLFIQLKTIAYGKLKSGVAETIHRLRFHDA